MITIDYLKKYKYNQKNITIENINKNNVNKNYIIKLCNYL